MNNDIELVKKAILARGLDDWVHIAEVLYVARQVRFGERLLAEYPAHESVDADELASSRDEWLARQERESLPLGLAAIKELLYEQAICVGDIASGHFVAWPERAQQLDSRIDAAVLVATYPMKPGELFWIENTSIGDEKAGSQRDRINRPGRRR